MYRLNGWNRLAVVLCSAWLIGCMSITATEYARPESGWFVSVSPPTGSRFLPGQLTLPNGRIIKLNADASEKPWQINWAAEPQVPFVLKLRWANILAVVVFPFIVWLLLTVLSVSLRWVKRGFRASAP